LIKSKNLKSFTLLFCYFLTTTPILLSVHCSPATTISVHLCKFSLSLFLFLLSSHFPTTVFALEPTPDGLPICDVLTMLSWLSMEGEDNAELDSPSRLPFDNDSVSDKGYIRLRKAELIG
ncbi:hypothetical protein H5410_020157, partial [Solanum commersonii]